MINGAAGVLAVQPSQGFLQPTTVNTMLFSVPGPALEKLFVLGDTYAADPTLLLQEKIFSGFCVVMEKRDALCGRKLRRQACCWPQWAVLCGSAQLLALWP